MLTDAGLDDPLWLDFNAVDAWCSVRALRRPDEAYAPYPRCLRDHTAEQWVQREIPHPAFPKLADWVRASEMGIPRPKGRIRLQARAKAAGIDGSWQYTGVLDAEEDPRAIFRMH